MKKNRILKDIMKNIEKTFNKERNKSNGLTRNKTEIHMKLYYDGVKKMNRKNREDKKVISRINSQ